MNDELEKLENIRLLSLPYAEYETPFKPEIIILPYEYSYNCTSRSKKEKLEAFEEIKTFLDVEYSKANDFTASFNSTENDYKNLKYFEYWVDKCKNNSFVDKCDDYDILKSISECYGFSDTNSEQYELKPLKERNKT